MQQQLAQLGNGAHALAIQMLGNADDASDAVHDAFVSVLNRPGAYDASKGSMKAWFMRVVRNRCIDQMRRRRPHDDAADEQPHPGPGPEQAISAEQQAGALQDALNRLKPEQRQLLVLRDYSDLSYAEISAVLDVPTGTVMSRLHRARLALKQELKDHEQ